MGDNGVQLPRWVQVCVQAGTVLAVVGVSGVVFALCVRGFLALLGGC
jgi:hypothetical protein